MAHEQQTTPTIGPLGNWLCKQEYALKVEQINSEIFSPLHKTNQSYIAVMQFTRCFERWGPVAAAAALY